MISHIRGWQTQCTSDSSCAIWNRELLMHRCLDWLQAQRVEWSSSANSRTRRRSNHVSPYTRFFEYTDKTITEVCHEAKVSKNNVLNFKKREGRGNCLLLLLYMCVLYQLFVEWLRYLRPVFQCFWGMFVRCLEGEGVSWRLGSVCRILCSYAVWLIACASLVPRCLHQVPIVHRSIRV